MASKTITVQIAILWHCAEDYLSRSAWSGPQAVYWAHCSVLPSVDQTTEILSLWFDGITGTHRVIRHQYLILSLSMDADWTNGVLKNTNTCFSRDTWHCCSLTRRPSDYHDICKLSTHWRALIWRLNFTNILKKPVSLSSECRMSSVIVVPILTTLYGITLHSSRVLTFSTGRNLHPSNIMWRYCQTLHFKTWRTDTCIYERHI